MGDTTTRRGFYQPGGGSQGIHGDDESADIDRINQTIGVLDTITGAPVLGSVSAFPSPLLGDHCIVAGVEYRYEGGPSGWVPWLIPQIGISYPNGYLGDYDTAANATLKTGGSFAGKMVTLSINAKIGGATLQGNAAQGALIQIASPVPVPRLNTRFDCAMYGGSFEGTPKMLMEVRTDGTIVCLGRGGDGASGNGVFGTVTYATV
jgi:hypothetical protein